MAQQSNQFTTRDETGGSNAQQVSVRSGGGHHSCFRSKGDMRDCVLSGRFTRAEDAELRALAAVVHLPVKEMVRTALMEWKARKEAPLQETEAVANVGRVK